MAFFHSKNAPQFHFLRGFTSTNNDDEARNYARVSTYQQTTASQKADLNSIPWSIPVLKAIKVVFIASQLNA